VERGTDINKVSKHDKPLLFDACKGGDEAIAKYLVRQVEGINETNICNENLFVYIREEGNETVIKYLVEHGANIYKKDNYGNIRLVLACFIGIRKLIRDIENMGNHIINKIENII